MLGIDTNLCVFIIPQWLNSYQLPDHPILFTQSTHYLLLSQKIKLKKIPVLEHDFNFSFLIVFAVNEYFMCLYLHEIMTMYMFVTVFALFLF